MLKQTPDVADMLGHFTQAIGEAFEAAPTNPNIVKKIGELARGNDIVLIGDNKHPDLNLQHFIMSGAVVDSLYDAGVKQIFIEMPQELQYHADDLANGVITRQQFIDNMEGRVTNLWYDDAGFDDFIGMRADLIIHAHEKGMKVQFADPGTGFHRKLPQEIVQMNDDIARGVFESHGLTFSADADENKATIGRNPEIAREIDNKKIECYSHLPDADKQRIADEFASQENDSDQIQLDMPARLNDTRLADYISDVAQGQKSAIIYGGTHDELEDILRGRGQSVGSIDIYPDGSQMSLSGNDVAGILKNDKVLGINDDWSSANSPAVTPAPAGP